MIGIRQKYIYTFEHIGMRGAAGWGISYSLYPAVDARITESGLYSACYKGIVSSLVEISYSLLPRCELSPPQCSLQHHFFQLIYLSVFILHSLCFAFPRFVFLQAHFFYILFEDLLPGSNLIRLPFRFGRRRRRKVKSTTLHVENTRFRPIGNEISAGCSDTGLIYFDRSHLTSGTGGGWAGDVGRGRMVGAEARGRWTGLEVGKTTFWTSILNHQNININKLQVKVYLFM